ncbi:GL14806 [Drosophila persimilis]|uniref:GL14806 n=1 Tax=Drosophila persimilis TaxID=7234 RepID=B4GQ32_DROPE|nr:protein LSM12 homolog B [Drosophila persimilis]EDW39704.1 GL14806 [Drosophila persimilis]
MLKAIEGAKGSKIAESLSCFTVGSTVRCKTCSDEEVLGKVVAFDAGTKLLMLEAPIKKRGASGRMLCERSIVNLNFCIDLEVVEEVAMPKKIPVPDALDLQKLQKRFDNAVKQRLKFLKSYHPKVSPMGTAIYCQFANYLGEDQVSWLEEDTKISIFVKQQVIIDPPYGVANINTATEATKLLTYVQRIVQEINSQN